MHSRLGVMYWNDVLQSLSGDSESAYGNRGDWQPSRAGEIGTQVRGDRSVPGWRPPVTHHLLLPSVELCEWMDMAEINSFG